MAGSAQALILHGHTSNQHRSDLQPYGANPCNAVSVRRRLDDFQRACRKGHFMPVAVVKSYDFGKTSQ